MVTDGGLDFGVGGFGLSEFVSIIQAAGHTVSTAHRQGVGPTTIAGAFNFATAAPAFNTDNFDQLWMFGISTAPAIAANEQATIARFMQKPVEGYSPLAITPIWGRRWVATSRAFGACASGAPSKRAIRTRPVPIEEKTRNGI